MIGSLTGIRVLDLTRVLAGPSCTQILGDLGAEVIKIEKPGAGDDTRKWGPPYVTNTQGQESTESAYYLSVNRNKKSIAIDIAHTAGQDLLKKLVSHCDILIENFKVGDMEKYGLAYHQLAPDFPELIYCSITGFGQNGPYAARPGYDLLAQAMGGLMSITGEANGFPMKVGVAVSDLTCGMYATIAVLAALNHRHNHHQGQYIDLSLLDSQVAWLANIGMNYLVSQQIPNRLGNEHPSIVPYKVMPCKDSYFVLAIGNDQQFSKFCQVAKCLPLANDPRFITNTARVKNREILYPLLCDITSQYPQKYWVEKLTAVGVPCSPVNNIAQVFSDPQILAREMKISMDYPESLSQKIELIGNPIKMSATPVTYRTAPPLLGQHTEEILKNILKLSASEIEALHKQNTIG